MSLSEASLLSNDYGFQEKITRKAIFVTVWIFSSVENDFIKQSLKTQFWLII
jgi:hypothetical protein